MEVYIWLERYDWYLDLSTKRQEWVQRLVEEVTPEVFVGMTAIHDALDKHEFSLLAELMAPYEYLSEDLFLEGLDFDSDD